MKLSTLFVVLLISTSAFASFNNWFHNKSLRVDYYHSGDFQTEYYSFDEESESYAWQSSWGLEEEGLLSGVKVAVTYKDGEQDVIIERTVFIPTIQKVFEIEVEEEEEDDDDDEEV